MSRIFFNGDSVLGGCRGVSTVGVGAFLGEARMSVVESSECSGVVGSFGPWIDSCRDVSLFGVVFCSVCVACGCCCVECICLGWSACDGVGGSGNWHQGHMNGSCSSAIFVLHAW